MVAVSKTNSPLWSEKTMKIISQDLRILWFNLFFFFPPPGNLYNLQVARDWLILGKEYFAWVCDHAVVIEVIILYHLLCSQHPFSVLSNSLEQVLFSDVVLFPGSHSVLSFMLTSDKPTSSSWTRTAVQDGCSLGWGTLRAGGAHESQTLLNMQQNMHGFW